MLKGKGNKMTVSIWGLIGILVIGAWLLASLIQSQEAYAESRKVSGTAKLMTELARDLIHLPDNISFILLKIDLWVLNSADPDWDNAYIFDVRHTDPNKLWVWKAYHAITHPGGGQTFMKFEGKEKPLEQEGGIRELKGLYIGGTGKFKGITGFSTFKDTSIATGESTAEWETEYEVK